ncbi:MAG: hypothetical protein JJ975_00380 [Bacteroidia bacterium]|nr:hypothetical protein [Bacteroidia bacterium]
MGFFDLFRSKRKSNQDDFEAFRAEKLKEFDEKFGSDNSFETLMAQAKERFAEKARHEAVDGHEFPHGEGEFGHSIDNPIPVTGIEESRQYLASLVFDEQSSDDVQWVRLGSGVGKHRELPVDIYQLLDNEGNVLTTLYLWPHNSVQSEKVPVGFSRRED